MRAFVPFAAFCLSVVAATAGAANLVELKEPAKIAGAFSPRAHVRVVNVWATWCVPCVEEMSDLRTISNTFGTQVSLVGVSLDDMIPGDRAATKRKVTDFLDQKRITYTNIYYRGTNDALGETLRFNGEIPITIVYDRTGREVWRQQGKLDRDKAIAEIRRMLGRKK
ncbi:MAG: TlpA family protein disulfide reductase [Acidobacteriota bacterium]|nr:TlpA family protein disulfide reductase [Acidobacteriota bacterium]